MLAATGDWYAHRLVALVDWGWLLEHCFPSGIYIRTATESLDTPSLRERGKGGWGERQITERGAELERDPHGGRERRTLSERGDGEEKTEKEGARTTDRWADPCLTPVWVCAYLQKLNSPIVCCDTATLAHPPTHTPPQSDSLAYWKSTYFSCKGPGSNSSSATF